jgi:hypothetical protein
MSCPHCGYPTIHCSISAGASGAKRDHLRAEACTVCVWWVAPPREQADPLTLARTSGGGMTTEIPW